MLACALFAAVSGSSPATVVAIGSILLPAMVKQGYPKSFGVGVIGTSGALGILMTVNMEIGMITPPVGLNLYGSSGIANKGLTDVTKACAPWILVMLAFLVLITYVPIISLWLPSLLMP